MKKLLLILAILPTLCFSQNFIGKTLTEINAMGFSFSQVDSTIAVSVRSDAKMTIAFRADTVIAEEYLFFKVEAYDFMVSHVLNTHFIVDLANKDALYQKFGDSEAFCLVNTDMYVTFGRMKVEQ